MRIERLDPPREFAVGDITISHAANVELDPDEQITFVTASGTEYDVARKSWGYYATPSMNSRLPAHGLHAALARNGDGRLGLMLVERGHEDEFADYLRREDMALVAWLDSDEAVAAAVEKLQS